ncbi:MAG: hypothetical protein IKY67_12270 [Paludibacteraceae bacterium]|nr:hypothetical protein [Paludibacteraceae bacterium]
MNKKFMKIDMQVVAKLNEDELNVLVGGSTGSGLKDLIGLPDININWNCKCTVVSNNVC